MAVTFVPLIRKLLLMVHIEFFGIYGGYLSLLVESTPKRIEIKYVY